MQEPTVLRYNSYALQPVYKMCKCVSCYSEDVIVDVALQEVLQKGRLDFEPNSMVVIRPLGSNRGVNKPFARNVTLFNH